MPDLTRSGFWKETRLKRAVIEEWTWFKTTNFNFHFDAMRDILVVGILKEDSQNSWASRLMKEFRAKED